MARNLTSVEEAKTKILKYIAEYAPRRPSDPQAPNKYVIRAYAKAGSQPTILAAVDELEKDGLIEPVHTDKKARGPKPSKHYGLELRGLFRYLSSIKDSQDLDRTVDAALKKHSHLLPSVFDIWLRLDRVKPLRAKKLIEVSEDALRKEAEGIALERWSSEDFLRDLMVPFRMRLFWWPPPLDIARLPIRDLRWFHSLSKHEDLKMLMLSCTEKVVKREISKVKMQIQDLRKKATTSVDSSKKLDDETPEAPEDLAIKAGLFGSALESANAKLEPLLADNLLYREPMKALETIEQSIWDFFRVSLVILDNPQ